MQYRDSKESRSIMQRAIEAVMRRSILVVVSVLLILGWGSVSAYQMERDYLPPINNSTLMISVRADNYQADQVKANIAGIINQAIKNVNGLQSVEINSFNGGMLCSLYFPFQFDMEKAEGEVSQALADLSLPPGVQKPLVTRVSTSSFPIMRISLVGQSPKVDENVLRTSLQNQVANELKNVPGVGEIRVTGGGQNGYVVTVRTKDLEKHGLTLDDVKQSLTSMNMGWPQGRMINYQIMVPVRVTSWAPTLEDVKEMGIHGKNGNTTPLAAVADVSPSLVDQQTVSRTEGKPSVILDVLKKPSANISDVSNQVHQRIQELQGALPSNVQMSVLFDQATDVQASLHGLIREGLWGCLFSMLSVFLFLRNLRSTILIALSLPICLLATTALLKWMGISLNILTVSGLVVAMGRVVDDSIVILDNMHRKIEVNDGKAQLYLLGAAVREMMPAIISSTATTICVFLPITLVGGVVQASFSAFAWTVVIALLVSLLVSLFVVPTFAHLWWGKMLRGSSQMVLEPLVRHILHWAISKRKWVIGLSIVIFAGTVVKAAFLPVNVLPASGPRNLSIQVALPEDSSPAAVNAQVKRVEDLLKKEPQIETFSSSLGSSFIPQFDDVFDDGGGWIQSASEANLSVKVKQNIDLNTYTAQLQNELRSLPSEAVYTVTNQNIAGDDSQLKVILSGADALTLDHAGRIIGSKLQLVPGLSVEGAENERKENSSYHLVLNRDKIKETGVKTEDIISRIQPYLSQGVRLDVSLGDQHVPFIMNTDVRSAASQPGKDMFALLGNETFRTKEGKTIKLQQLLSPAPGSTLSVYRERDGKPISVITANITTPDVEKATKQAERVLEGVSLPKGVSYSIGGISQQVEQMIVDMAIALSISTLLVLFIVSTVFRGWKAPASVLVCIPLLLIGSVWGMVLFGKEWNLAAFIGVLMLVGIVVTNGIVLVDKIERNIRSGMMPEEAILQGTLSRVRPVLMTAFTTILTVLPLALSTRTDSVISQTLGIVVVGGMLSSTLISLLFIPILYDWMYKSSFSQGVIRVPVFKRNRDIQTTP